MDESRMSRDFADKTLNYRYMLKMFSSLVLACMQAGFAIGSNNQVGPILAVQFSTVDPTFL